MMPMHPPQLSPAMINSPVAGMAGMMPPVGMHMMPSNHNMGMGMGMGMGTGMGMGMPFPGMMPPHGIPRKYLRTTGVFCVFIPTCQSNSAIKLL